MDHTPVDLTYLAHEAEPDNERLHHRFLERVMDAELYILTETESDGGTVRPRIMDLADGRFVLAFDRDGRLAEFLDEPAPYIALAGRRLVEMLAGQDIGVALNLGVAPSSTLLPAGAIDWLAENLVAPPDLEDAKPDTISTPGRLSQDLLDALDTKLAAMAHLIGEAHLVESGFANADSRLMLGLVAVPEPARTDVAAAMAEAVRFSSSEADLDVTFLEKDSPALGHIQDVSIRFDLPEPSKPEKLKPLAPGMNPDKPPVLR